MNRPLAPGFALTTWKYHDLRGAWHDADALARDARPQIIQLHTGPEEALSHAGEIAAAVRAALPGTRIWLGIGMDAFPSRLGLGVERLVAEAVKLGQVAERIGAEHLVLDAEAAWKATDPAERAREQDLARAILRGIAQACPGLVLGHTAYDQPGLHGTYAWQAWLGAGSPVRYTWPQVYASTGGDTMAARGALARRERASLESYKAAVRRQIVRPDLPGEDMPDSLEFRPYEQAHGVPYPDTITLGAKYGLAAAWAAPTRIDEDGRIAVRALSELYRQSYYGPDAVQRFQLAHGLTADGICGPKTLAVLLARDAPSPQPAYGTGEACVRRAKTQLGDPYRWGAIPDKTAADPSAYDCAELVTWAVYQGAGVLAGTSRNNTDDPRIADASSADWYDQTRRGILERIELSTAARIAGAVLVKHPRRDAAGKLLPGHVALSDGKGRMVEAAGGRGVIDTREVGAVHWDLACLVPGVVYTRPA